MLLLSSERDLSCVVHGDDFTCLGSDANLDWYEKQLAISFEIKVRGRLGQGCAGPNEIRILNRIVRIEKDGLHYEADPRHIDMIAESLNITAANSVCTPGIKNADPSTEPESKAEDSVASSSNGWGDAQNLSELLCAPTGDERKPKRQVSFNLDVSRHECEKIFPAGRFATKF